MRIGILVPDRGDRTEFLRNCRRMIDRQTLQPVEVEIVNDPPRSEAIDIGWRYKIGYQRLQNKNLDLIAFIENDDWYHPEYLEIMAKMWEETGKPLLLGTDYTVYYHLKLKKYFTFHHTNRSSAMNTVIRPNIDNIDWGQEFDPYTDMHLWTKIGKEFGDRIVFHPDKHISVGIKHAIGKTGGFAHKFPDDDGLDFSARYENDDNGFLQSVIDPVDHEGWMFYQATSEALINGSV